MAVSNGVPVNLIFVLLVLAALLAIPVLIGVYVCRDARRRGMNAVAWTLIAVAAPALVGFIIYLLARGNYPDLECPQCGEGVAEQYVACPRCGARLRPACPNCSAPVEPDWKVCPRCAAPLDGAGERVTPPRRRQDKGLKKILIAVIVAPVVLVGVAVAGYVLQHAQVVGSVSLDEFTFEQYDQRQTSWTVRNAVHQWLDEIERSDQRSNRAYILQYECSDRFVVENYYYMLIYVPGAGHRSVRSFEVGSGLFKPALMINMTRTENEAALICAKVKSMRAPMPKITVGGKEIGCMVRSVDYNPTTFYLAPDYSQVKQGDDVFYPERISVVKYVGHESVDIKAVTDKDMMLQILASIDSGERVPMDPEQLPDFDFRDGFEIIVEYRIQEGLIMHEDMARHLVYLWGGECYLHDDRVRNTADGSPYRVMGNGFYVLLDSLFEEGTK